jgi:peptidoglycan/xylan/chitin deacetylase (PgdA/CDA1 family)
MIKTRQALEVVTTILSVALAACAPAGPLPATPTAAGSTPSSAAPTATVEETAPTLTATAAPPVEQLTPDSKYANVYVYTIEEQANEGRSLLHVAYPVTEHPAINARLQALAEEFIDEFRTQSAVQEAAYQDYVRKTGETAASFVTHYIQHFDVTIADAKLISLAIERYRFGGGTGSTEVTGYVFDRAAGTELTPADLFISNAYLERLALLAREELERRAHAQAAEAQFDSEAVREEWLANLSAMIRAGTEPLAENYDGILFLEDGTLSIQFDKYQVGPGSDGVVTVSVPVDRVADLLTPNMRELLGVTAPTPAPTPPPSPTPAPLSTPTLAPPTPGAGPAPAGVDCGQALCVALTFDDGPSIYTDGLLDILQAHHAPATFFVLGRSARVQTRTITRMAQEGHEIGNHSWSHLNLKDLTEEQIQDQVDQTNTLVAEITGTTPRYLRPPYGTFNDYVVATVQMPVILWSLDPLDWKDRDADLIVERMREASSGAIILAHDIYTSTVNAMPAVLESLANRGIHFVTVSELMAPEELVSGRVYGRRLPP